MEQISLFPHNHDMNPVMKQNLWLMKTRAQPILRKVDITLAEPLPHHLPGLTRGRH